MKIAGVKLNEVCVKDVHFTTIMQLLFIATSEIYELHCAQQYFIGDLFTVPAVNPSPLDRLSVCTLSNFSCSLLVWAAGLASH